MTQQAKDELNGIFDHMKRTMRLHQAMGFEPPPISVQAKAYLSGKRGREGDDTPRPHLVSLDLLRAHIGACERCKLGAERRQLVFGEGSSVADLVFVGEGPGREEDRAGRPFVGEAGKLLTRIIEAMGLTRNQVYICNVVKCRPPNNRDPELDEVETCRSFLEQQLKIIKPKVICTLGRIAAQTLIHRDFKITRERGTWHTHAGIQLMPTYHPAYLLRNPSAKRQVWEDIQQIMKHLGLEVKKND